MCIRLSEALSVQPKRDTAIISESSRRSFGLILSPLTVLPFLCPIASIIPSNVANADELRDPPKKKLNFVTLPSGVKVADILIDNKSDGGTVVTPTSKVNVHVIGRLLGKNGWIFEDSQASGEDPFRLDLGTGTVVPGLEEALVGMKAGGRRRIVVPSAVGYTSRDLQPIPRDFGNRQRLYTTVMNTVRTEREKQALGADLAGAAVFDVELLRLRN